MYTPRENASGNQKMDFPFLGKIFFPNIFSSLVFNLQLKKVVLISVKMTLDICYAYLSKHRLGKTKSICPFQNQ